jgi:copper chaperone CopZ
MKRGIVTIALLLVSAAAFAAEPLKVTVGHLCCGGCKTAATAGLKSVSWIDTSTTEGSDTIVVTPKKDQKVDLISLVEALNKSGFPARQINVSTPVVMSIAHLCCGGCVNDLKTKIGNVNSEVLDKANVKVDATAKTLTLQPVAGKMLNVASILRSLQNQGFYPSSVSIVEVTKSARK